MLNLNKIEIIGNLGSDPELRFTPNGKPVTNFTVAYDRKYTSNGETKEETIWFNVIAWSKLAELCNQYLTKGQSVYVSGSIRLHEWEAQDGAKRARLELNARDVVFLSRSEQKTQDELELEDAPF